jgi:hypothetical protein
MSLARISRLSGCSYVEWRIALCEDYCDASVGSYVAQFVLAPSPFTPRPWHAATRRPQRASPPARHLTPRVQAKPRRAAAAIRGRGKVRVGTQQARGEASGSPWIEPSAAAAWRAAIMYMPTTSPRIAGGPLQVARNGRPGRPEHSRPGLVPPGAGDLQFRRATDRRDRPWQEAQAVVVRDDDTDRWPIRHRAHAARSGLVGPRARCIAYFVPAIYCILRRVVRSRTAMSRLSRSKVPECRCPSAGERVPVSECR